jgi:hypothetical protein
MLMNKGTRTTKPREGQGSTRGVVTLTQATTSVTNA